MSLEKLARRAAVSSESVGVVVPGPGSELFSDPVLPRLLRGIGDALSAAGKQMVLFAPRSQIDMDRLQAYMAGGHVDGVILLLGFGDTSMLAARLHALGTPVVVGGRPRNGVEVSFVDVDNQVGGRRATEHLIEQGRRRIAHIAGPPGMTNGSDRLQGFREAMWNAALRSDLVEHGNLDRDSGELAMARLLNRTDDIDAVFAATDAMAAGAMWAMQILGRRVPDDVAIIGFDDSPLAAATQPPLSSVRRPIEAMGAEMARLVVGMAEAGNHSAPQHLILDPALTVRESTRPATRH